MITKFWNFNKHTSLQLTPETLIRSFEEIEDPNKRAADCNIPKRTIILFIKDEKQRSKTVDRKTNILALVLLLTKLSLLNIENFQAQSILQP